MPDLFAGFKPNRGQLDWVWGGQDPKEEEEEEGAGILGISDHIYEHLDRPRCQTFKTEAVVEPEPRPLRRPYEDVPIALWGGKSKKVGAGSPAVKCNISRSESRPSLADPDAIQSLGFDAESGRQEESEEEEFPPLPEWLIDEEAPAEEAEIGPKKDVRGRPGPDRERRRRRRADRYQPFRRCKEGINYAEESESEEEEEEAGK